MDSSPLMSLARAGRGCGRRNQSARHRLPHPPTVPGILQFLGVQIADRSTQESSVQRAVQLGSLLPPERNLMRTAGWPGI